MYKIKTNVIFLSLDSNYVKTEMNHLPSLHVILYLTCYCLSPAQVHMLKYKR